MITFVERARQQDEDSQFHAALERQLHEVLSHRRLSRAASSASPSRLQYECRLIDSPFASRNQSIQQCRRKTMKKACVDQSIQGETIHELLCISERPETGVRQIGRRKSKGIILTFWSNPWLSLETCSCSPSVTIRHEFEEISLPAYCIKIMIARTSADRILITEQSGLE